MPEETLTTEAAAAVLGVTKATLYAYVSRGLLRSYPDPGGGRQKVYRRTDVHNFLHRRSFRNDPERAASEVMEFGTPILPTAISMIGSDYHGYRGVHSKDLIGTASFEQVCEFLWHGTGPEEGLAAPSPRWADPLEDAVVRRVDVHRDLGPVERMQALLPHLERQSLHAYGTRVGNLLPSAIGIMRYFVYVATGRPPGASLAQALGDAWGADAAALETVLTMVADHELNIATFTARCAASAGASLHHSVLAGLCSLQGSKHLLGQIAEARGFFQEVLDRGDPEKVVRRYLQRSAPIPGFHNPYRKLYPAEDPRVPTLLANLAGCAAHEAIGATVDLVIAGANEYPRVDFALAVTEHALGLPRDAIFSVVAIGRTAGVIAHVLEQFSSERLIRPRAKYVGPMASVP